MALSPVASDNGPLTTDRFEARLLWVDFSANLGWTLDPEAISEFCRKARNAGFNELVIDVKPINGKLFYAGAPSQERITTFRGFTIPEDYDLLGEFVRRGKAEGLKISVCLNVFSEGHSHFPGVGIAYEKPEVQTQAAHPIYHVVLGDGTRLRIGRAAEPGIARLASETEPGIPLPGALDRVIAHPDDQQKISEHGIASVESDMAILPQTDALPELIAVFVDPLAPGIRERIFRVIEDVVRAGVDCIVFDRMRYAALGSGMGQEMRAEFERRYGPVGAWPESIFTPNPRPGRPMQRGPRFAEWMQFRAEVITEFVRDATALVRRIAPGMPVGTYVGGGWETYFDVGVNYATDRAWAPYAFAWPEYGLAGYAGYMDFITTGLFYRVAREVDPGVAEGRERFTIEGGARLMRELVGEATLLYPGLYGLDWEGNPEGLREAVRAAIAGRKGFMFFDAIYIVRNENWWSIFEEELGGPTKLSPHFMPSYPRRTPAPVPR